MTFESIEAVALMTLAVMLLATLAVLFLAEHCSFFALLAITAGIGAVVAAVSVYMLSAAEKAERQSPAARRRAARH